MYLRRLHAQDTAAVRDHLLRLDSESRRLRFFGTVGDASVAQHAEGLDWSRTEVFGAYISGELRGVVEVVGMADGNGDSDGEAELALTVEPVCQGHGVGGALLRRAVIYARNHGIRRLRLVALSENRRLHALAGHYPHERKFEDGCIDHAIDIWPTTPGTLAEEAVDEALGGAQAAAFQTWAAFDAAWAAMGLGGVAAAGRPQSEAWFDALRTAMGGTGARTPAPRAA